MGIVKLISRMVNESEHDIQRRFKRARSLASEEYSIGIKQALTGRIFAVTTWRRGKGEEDFTMVLRRHHHDITKIFRINWLHHSDKALHRVLVENWDQFISGDIVAIVRGGGDTSEAQFSPFQDQSSFEMLLRLRNEKDVVLITGIGHSSDSFFVEGAATFNQATPTDAAYKVCELLRR